MASKTKKGDSFKQLVSIMAQLRDKKDGCPWDKEQSLETLRQYVLEEAYEVVEAIDKKDKKAVCEELGDLLLQVVFQSQIADEAG